MATGSLADALNEALGATQQPGPGMIPAPAPAIQPNTQGWFGRAKDYIADTDWGALGEAMLRVNPMTLPAMLGADIAKGKGLDNYRLMAGQVSRFPTDIAAGVVGLYPTIASIRSASTGVPMSSTAVALGEAADAIDKFGLRNWAEPIAGRQLGTSEQGIDQAGSLLRGTGPEMAGQWARLMSQAIAPVPTKIAAPIVAGANMIRSGINAATGGVKAIDTATVIAGKTIESLTPLAISTSPSVKTAVVNMAVQGVTGPAAEAAVEALMPAREAERVQAAADKAAKDGSAQATAGATQAVEGATQLKQGADVAAGRPVTPKTAGISTGDTTTDVLGAAAIAGIALYGWKKRDLFRRIKDGETGATKHILGYDSSNLDDANKQTWATKLQQQVSDGSASLPASLKAALKSHGTFSPQAVDNMVGRFAEETASQKGAGLSTRLRNWMFSGEYLDTNIKSKPLNDLAVEHQAATKMQQDMFSQREWALQELHFRQRMVLRESRGGTTPLGTSPVGSPGAEAALLRMEQAASRTPTGAAIFQGKYAHNLYGMTSRQLRNIINTADADPVVRNLSKGYRNILDSAADYMKAEKRFTAPQVWKFKQENPNYVPPRIEKGGNYLDPREPVATLNPHTGLHVQRGAETFKELGNPMQTLPRYMDEVFRSTEGKKIQRDYISTMTRAARAGNKVAQDIIGRELHGKPGADVAHRFVSWRDAQGNQRYIEIKDAVVRDALKGVTSPTKLQLSTGAVSWFNHLYQSGAVGPLSLIHGTVFAPKSALYTATIGSALPRPKGVAIGAIDRLAQNTLGVSVPGIDALTTLPIHMAVRAAGNVGAVVVERGARVMHNAVLTNGILTKALDPATLQKYADAANAWYKRTQMYDMQRQGLMSPGSGMMVDPAAMYNNPEKALRGAKGIAGAGGHFIEDILHAISSAPAMAILDTNRALVKKSATGMPNPQEWKVASTIRNLSGDPGSSGAFRNAGAVAELVNATPWGNIYIQSLTRLATAFKNNPGYTTMGLFNAAALPAIMATMWNNEQGPEYTDWQYFGRTPDQVSSSIYIAPTGGRAPNEGMEIALDPLSRFAKLIGEGIAGAMFGAFSGEMWKPGNEDMRRGYKEMINHRMFGVGEGTVSKSLLEQSLLPPVPGLAQTTGALMGVRVKSYIDINIPKERDSQGFATEDMKAQTANPLDSVIPGLSQDVLRGIGASAAAAIYQYVGGMVRDTDPNAARIGNETKTPAQAAGTQVAEWKQRVGDSTSQVSGPLFGNFRAKVPSQEAASQVVKTKLDGIKAVVDQYQATTVRGAPRDQLGQKGKFTTPEAPIGTHPAQPSTLQGSVAADIAQLYSKLAPTLSELNKFHNQRAGIANSNLFSPEMKRGMQEIEADKIIKLNRRLLQDLQRAEQNMTNRYGVKIDFSNLKLQ